MVTVSTAHPERKITVDPQPILRSHADLLAAHQEVDRLMAVDPDPASPEGVRLTLLVAVIAQYEALVYSEGVERLAVVLESMDDFLATKLDEWDEIMARLKGYVRDGPPPDGPLPDGLDPLAAILPMWSEAPLGTAAWFVYADGNAYWVVLNVDREGGLLPLRAVLHGPVKLPPRVAWPLTFRASPYGVFV